MQKEPVLELKNITMGYGDNLVLDNASIALYGGMIHCLLGYNSLEKSTMAKIISGECRASSGELYFENAMEPMWDTGIAVSRGIAMINGRSSLFPFGTVYENVEYSLMRGSKAPLALLRNRSRLRRELREFTRRYGISCSYGTPFLELSNGDRVLLELLRVRLMDVKVLLLDEIDVMLGSRHKKIIRELIRDFKDNGIAILYISHKMDMVRQMADQVSVLQYGSVQKFAQRETFAESELADMMFSSSQGRPPRTHITAGEELLYLSRKGEKGSLVLHEGEIVGILNQRGNGKGDLCSLLSGIKHGEALLRLRGRRVRKICAEDALKNGLVVLSSTVMQRLLFPGYTVEKNMLPYSLRRRVRNKQRRIEICQRYINILNIKATPTAIFDTLSMGSQRKVFIARCILSKGDIFIFDNPTDSIDSVSKVDIYNIINQMKNFGKGILFLSDDPCELSGISDRIVIMKNNHFVTQYETLSYDQKELLAFMDSVETNKPEEAV